jgi:hypothetical protein
MLNLLLYQQNIMLCNQRLISCNATGSYSYAVVDMLGVGGSIPAGCMS